MSRHHVIAIGASAGGVEALTQVVRTLPPDLSAAVFIVLHIPAYGASVLPDILSRKGPLPASHPADGEAILPGRIYVAPPDHHLLVDEGRVRVTRGPSENGHRPAVDPLFRSAARACGPNAVGVILSGTLDDGTAGLLAIKQRGGFTVVQDPEEALFSGMPRSAVENVDTDAVVPAAEIGPMLALLTRRPLAEMASAPAELETEVGVAEMNMDAAEQPRAGTPSGFTCPECHGALWEVEDGELTRFRCRTGHAYSPDSLIAQQSQDLENALWVAFRALEESAALADRLCERAQGRGHGLTAERFHAQADDARQRAEIVRLALLRGQLAAPNSPAAVSENTSGLNQGAGKRAV